MKTEGFLIRFLHYYSTPYRSLIVTLIDPLKGTLKIPRNPRAGEARSQAPPPGLARQPVDEDEVGPCRLRLNDDYGDLYLA